jgi:putative hydrolase of the HAD superfamily
MTGPRFDALLFDAGGVLVLPDPTVLAPLLEPLGGDPSIAAHRRAHYAAMAVKSIAGAGESSWREYDAAYVASIGVEPSQRDAAAALLNTTRTPALWCWPIPESVAALAELAAREVPIGVVSNASGQIEAELARAGVCQVGTGAVTGVRCVIDSHVVGVTKPDPRIFDHALAHFDGFDRDRIAYIGDSVTMDVGGARAAGLHPVLLDPHDDHAGADFDRIRSLADVIPLVSR